MLIVAPMSGHYATLLRGTVEAFLPTHDVYITDWSDARMVPLAEGRFDLEDYVDYVIEMLHVLGGNMHVIAVCQPSVPVVAAVSVMEAEHDPFVPLSMTLMGGPIDTRRNPTAVNNLAAERGIEWFRNNVITKVPFPHPGVMRDVYPGFLQLNGFISMNFDRHMDAHKALFSNLVKGDGDLVDKHREFYDEYLAVMDLTAEYYLQTVDIVFVKHALPKGEMTHRGKPVDPSKIKRVALMTVEGEKDDISGPRADRSDARAVHVDSRIIAACTTCRRASDTTACSTVRASARKSCRAFRISWCRRRRTRPVIGRRSRIAPFSVAISNTANKPLTGLKESGFSGLGRNERDLTLSGLILGPNPVRNFWFQPLPVGVLDRSAPVYWANDLFLRRAISLAADMAESGRTPAPRTFRHGYSRAPLSAACRTLDCFGQTRLANLCDQIAPASACAPLHLAHSSDRPRSDPDHAAARHDRGSKGLCAASRRLDRRASRPFAEGRTIPSGHRDSAARRAAPDRASRRRARHGVDGNAATAARRSSASPAASNIMDRRVHDFLKREARKDLHKAALAYARGSRRQGQAGVDPRPVEPLGFVHLGRIAVVLLAADPGAALRAGLSRRP